MVGVSARQIKSEGCPNDEIFVKLLNLTIFSESFPKNGVGKIV